MAKRASAEGIIAGAATEASCSIWRPRPSCVAWTRTPEVLAAKIITKAQALDGVNARLDGLKRAAENALLATRTQEELDVCIERFRVQIAAVATDAVRLHDGTTAATFATRRGHGVFINRSSNFSVGAARPDDDEKPNPPPKTTEYTCCARSLAGCSRESCSCRAHPWRSHLGRRAVQRDGESSLFTVTRSGNTVTFDAAILRRSTVVTRASHT
ncbi:hypothetical protein [Paraburkholderia fungorum]|uniref:hypothetical protein n=1 Tax=Paraburkholderia fungorum TaxID=134537 RepID=UPI00402B319A